MHASLSGIVTGALSLGTLAGLAARVDGVRRADLRPGDRLLVSTRNSVYCIKALGEDRYEISGGWFAQRGLAPAVVGIHGCTFGGRALHTGLLAARGLYLEFGNAVTTTRIREIFLVRQEEILN